MKQHLTKEQRYTISVMLEQGKTKTEVAKIINKDKSVVTREIQRNSDQRSGTYRYELAHRKYEKRMKEKRKNSFY